MLDPRRQDADVAVLLQRCRNAESCIMRQEERVRTAAEEAAERLGRLVIHISPISVLTENHSGSFSS